VTPENPQAPRRLWDSPWIRKLPLLVMAGIGIAFFLPRMPHDVDVEYHLGSAAQGLRSADIEVFNEAGQPVHRTVVQGQAAQHPEQHLRLPTGDYRVELKLEYADKVDHRASSFHVEGAGLVEVDVSHG
jgi:hypothetical protein